MAEKIVIEVNGGVVSGVYCDNPDIDVVLVDWDNIKHGDDPSLVVCDKLDHMDKELRDQVSTAMYLK